MAETGGDAVDGKRCDVGVEILQQHETGLRGAHFRNRSGNRTRQQYASGNRRLRRRLHSRNHVHEIEFGNQRRALQHDRRDIRLVGGKRMHDDGRRLLARREHFRQRAAHQRRWIVEQHDHRAFSGGEIVGRELGMEIGAGQRRCGVRPFAGRRGPKPMQELTNNHKYNRRYDKAALTGGTL